MKMTTNEKSKDSIPKSTRLIHKRQSLVETHDGDIREERDSPERENVHQKDDGKWYFWTESYDECGPYDTKDEAERKLDKYVEWLDTVITNINC